MSDLAKFLNDISKKDWSSAEIPVTSENRNDRAVPWLLQGSVNATCEILKEYHKWLLDNYNLTPKK